MCHQAKKPINPERCGKCNEEDHIDVNWSKQGYNVICQNPKCGHITKFIGEKGKLNQTIYKEVK